jgi:serine protease Do
MYRVWGCIAIFALAFALGASSSGSEKNHARVLSAFRPVVEDASKSTVRVYVDGKRKALGTVVDASGYVATKASELQGKTIECEVHGGRKLVATLVGIDKERDLAMVKLDAADLKAIVWSDATAPGVGSWVATPGLDKDPLSVGVVSVDVRPIARARGALAVVLSESNDGTGPYIQQTLDGGAAERAGLLPGDRITHVADKPTPKVRNVKDAISAFEPDDTVKVKIVRADQEMEITVVLSNFNTMMPEDRANFQNSLGSTLSTRRSGFPMVLQHDTVLLSQYCGGPLVDLTGKAVGINIARAGRVESYALPAATVKEILEKLKSGELAPARPPVTETTSAAASPADDSAISLTRRNPSRSESLRLKCLRFSEHDSLALLGADLRRMDHLQRVIGVVEVAHFANQAGH